jgi:hypothetical protein
MIVPSMSNEEIIKELLHDVDIVTRKAEYLHDELKRLLIKSKEYPFTKTYEYVTPKSKNNWIFILEIKSKKESFATAINYHYTDIGLRAAMITSTKSIVFYTGHFFTRYAEREALNLPNPVDKMKKFFTMNPHTNFKVERKLEEGVFELFGTASTGVLLGKKVSHNLMIINTYLSNELLKGNQTIVSSQQKAELDYYIANRKA